MNLRANIWLQRFIFLCWTEQSKILTITFFIGNVQPSNLQVNLIRRLRLEVWLLHQIDWQFAANSIWTLPPICLCDCMSDATFAWPDRKSNASYNSTREVAFIAARLKQQQYLIRRVWLVLPGSRIILANMLGRNGLCQATWSWKL